jgi:hypothetical protein
MENEKWLPVVGFEGLYEISDLGKVKRNNKILKNQIRTGYPKVTLMANRFKKQISVHRLVAIAFIPNPENKLEVNHINGIKTDNRVENLEWCSRKENAQHSYDNKLQKPQKGSCHGGSKLSEIDIINIRNRFIKGESSSKLSKDFNIALSTLSQIVNYKRWKHVK